MAILFPMIYSIIIGNKLIAAKIDNGSMSNYLSTPVSRKKIVVSSAVYITISLIIMWVIVTIIGIITANLVQPNSLDIDKFILLNIGVFLYHFAVSSICFISSCIFNTSKKSLLVGAGLPILFFIINLLVKLSDNLDVLKFFTLTTLFNTTNIINGTNYISQFITLSIIGIILYVTSIEIFKRKNLPL